MTPREQKDLFASNLTRYMNSADKSQIDLAKDLGVSAQLVNNWVNAKSIPRMDKVELLARYFGISKTDLLDDPSSNRSKKYVRIPVLGRVAAGTPIEEIEDVIGYEEIPTEWTRGGKKYFALRLRGNSMEPRMFDGDIVIVQEQPDVESGDIAIVRVNGYDATCKKVLKQSDGIMIVGLNPAFTPIFYSNDQIRSLPVEIDGKVVELRAKF